MVDRKPRGWTDEMYEEAKKLDEMYEEAKKLDTVKRQKTSDVKTLAETLENYKIHWRHYTHTIRYQISVNKAILPDEVKRLKFEETTGQPNVYLGDFDKTSLERYVRENTIKVLVPEEEQDNISGWTLEPPSGMNMEKFKEEIDREIKIYAEFHINLTAQVKNNEVSISGSGVTVERVNNALKKSKFTILELGPSFKPIQVTIYPKDCTCHFLANAMKLRKLLDLEFLPDVAPEKATCGNIRNAPRVDLQSHRITFKPTINFLQNVVLQKYTEVATDTRFNNDGVVLLFKKYNDLGKIWEEFLPALFRFYPNFTDARVSGDTIHIKFSKDANRIAQQLHINAESPTEVVIVTPSDLEDDELWLVNFVLTCLNLIPGFSNARKIDDGFQVNYQITAEDYKQLIQEKTPPFLQKGQKEWKKNTLTVKRNGDENFSKDVDLFFKLLKGDGLKPPTRDIDSATFEVTVGQPYFEYAVAQKTPNVGEFIVDPKGNMVLESVSKPLLTAWERSERDRIHLDNVFEQIPQPTSTDTVLVLNITSGKSLDGAKTLEIQRVDLFMANYMDGIAELTELKEQGITHRNIRPETIMLSDEGDHFRFSEFVDQRMASDDAVVSSCHGRQVPDIYRSPLINHRQNSFFYKQSEFEDYAYSDKWALTMSFAPLLFKEGVTLDDLENYTQRACRYIANEDTKELVESEFIDLLDKEMFEKWVSEIRGQLFHFVA